eukprot:gene1194-1376_t
MSRPQLKGTKSNFALATNVNAITNERVQNYLRTEVAVQQWIEDVLQIPKLKGLHELRNGIVLCYLANALAADVVPKVQENTNIEFKLQENIIFFLAALEDLGLPKHKRFQVNDLWFGENRVKVVECLSALAMIAQKKEFKPEMKPINPNTPVVMPTGEPLRELKYLLAQIKEPVKQARGGRKGATILKTQMALLAGNSIDFAKCERGFIAFQTLWRGFKARKLLNKMKRDGAYRDKITQEIFKTETDYVNNLSICISEYMNPMKELVSKDQIKSVFSDIQIIHSFGQKLIEKLRPRIDAWDHYQKLGDIFLEIADFLKVYTSYIQNYNNALTTLEELRKKDKSVVALLDTARNLPVCKNFELTAFLIMPIQRVPRYNLLLMDLVKHTWPEHPDYTTLCSATERMRGIATFLNEKKREGENFLKFTEIQSSLVGNKVPSLFCPTRRYITSGQFVTSKKEEISIFLFNDIVVYGKPIKSLIGASTSKKVKYQGMLQLIDTVVVEDATLPENQLMLKSTEVTLCLVIKSEDERTEWTKNLKNHIKDLKEKDQVRLETKANGGVVSPAKPAEVKEKEVEAPSVEQLLQERRKRGATLAPPVTLSTSVSQPSSPVHSPAEPMSPTAPASPSIQPSNQQQQPLSFIGSLFGSKKKSGNEQHADDGVDSTDNAEQPTTPEISPSSGDPTAKASRPKKKSSKKLVAQDDSEIGLKKMSLEDGGRSKAPSRLQRLTGTLRRRKSEKPSSDTPKTSDDSTTTTETAEDSKSHPSISVDAPTGEDESGGSNSSRPLSSGPPSPAQSPPSSPSPLAHSNNNNNNNKVSPPPRPSTNYDGTPKIQTTTTTSPTTSLSTSSSSSTSSSITPSTGTMTYEEIIASKAELDQTKLESYLLDEEYQKVFQVDSAAFFKLPKWRQDQRKKSANLL